MAAHPDLRAALRRHGWALLLLVALSFLLTWPLARHFTTHLPGDGIDDPALVWNLWWIKTRLVDHIQPDIFDSGWMFHPIGINLAFYTLTPLNGLLSIPLQSAFSLVTASNLVLLSSFVLGGYGAYLLTLQVTSWGRGNPNHMAAAVAGIIYAFASSKLFYASLGQFNIASSQWIPFYVLYLWRLGQSATRRAALHNGLRAGLFLGFQAWAELTYASFLFIFTALYALWWLFLADRPPLRRALPVAAQGTLALVAVSALLLIPFLAAMLPDLRQEGDFFASGGGFADIFSADLAGFWLPTPLHPIWGDWAAQLPFPNDKGQHLYLGYSALLMALLGTVAGLRNGRAALRATLFWLAAFLVFVWLSLGPTLRWMGADTAIPGPFALVSRLPFFSGNRYPSRYSVMLMLCLAVLAAQGVAWTMGRARRLSPRIVAAAVALVFVGEHLSVPLLLTDMRAPPLYAQLAAIPGDFAILELPTGWRNGARVLGREDLIIMRQQWDQTIHGKRRLGGNTSRNPETKFQYFSEAPLIGDLIALMNADRDHLAPTLEAIYPEMVERGRRLAPQLLDFLDVRYVTLHTDRAPALLIRYVEDALPLDLVSEWQGTDWTGAPAAIRLYAVRPVPIGTQTFDLASAEAHHLLAEGWSSAAAIDGPRYATRPTPTLLLDLPDRGGQVTLTLDGPTAARYTLNGVGVSHEADGPIHRLAIAPGLADQPVDRLQITFLDAPRTAAELAASSMPQGAPIGATGASVAPGVAVVIRSAGQEVGDFAHIRVNGVEAAANQRGYNLVALSPDGVILDTAVFDTLQEGEAARLAAWVRQWPEGTIIAGAVADEASLHLSEEAVQALQSLGVAGDLRGKFRWSHAFLGAVGAPPNSALEQTSLITPSTIYAAAPVDAPAVYGGVSQVEVVPSP